MKSIKDKNNSDDQFMTRQVAQLSQTDRAAGWVSYRQKWKTNWETIFMDIIGLYSTTATYLANKEIEIDEKNTK